MLRGLGNYIIYAFLSAGMVACSGGVHDPSSPTTASTASVVTFQPSYTVIPTFTLSLSNATPSAGTAAMIIITATDQFGKIAPKAVKSISISVGNGTSIGSTSGITSDTPGVYKAKFVSFSVSDPQPVRVTVNDVLLSNQPTIEVIPAAPATLTIVDGNNQSAPPNQSLPQPVKILVRDIYGNPVGRLPVTFTPLPGSGTVSAGLTTMDINTDINGNAAAAWTVGNTIGPQSLIASIANTALSVNFTTFAVNPPASPTTVIAQGASKSVSLSWTPGNAGGGLLTYQIERTTTSGANYAVVATKVPTPFFTDVTADNNTLYYYRVIADNGTYQSTPSSEAHARPIAALIAGGDPHNKSVLFHWSDALGATQYQINYGTIPGAYTNHINNLTFAQAPFSITGLVNDTNYFFELVATNADNGYVTTGPLMIVPTTAFKITSGSAGAGSATFTWTDAGDTSLYTIQYGLSSGNYTTSLTNKVSGATVTGLSNGTDYYFILTAQNGALMGEQTEEFIVTPLAAMTISSLTSTGVGNGSLSACCAVGATHYLVNYGPSPANLINSIDTVNPAITISGLTVETSYSFQVQALNDHYGNSKSAAFTVPRLSIDPTADAQAGELDHFGLSLTAASTRAVTLNYATANGTALSGTHYLSDAAVKTIPAGQAANGIAIQTLPPISNDGTIHYFGLNISQAQNAILTNNSSIAGVINPTLDLDFTTDTLNAVVIANRASPASYYDSTGYLKVSEQNLFIDSENFAVWPRGENGMGVFPTVTADFGNAPDGTPTADFIQSPGGGAPFLYQDTASLVGGTYSGSLWVKGTAGESFNYFQRSCDWQNDHSEDISFNGRWQKVSFVGRVATDNCVRIGIQSINNAPSGFYVWGAQINEGTSVANYVKTTTSAVTTPYTARFDHDPYTLSSKGILIEKSQTNLIPSSNDFSHGSWMQVSGMSVDAATGITAPDGSNFVSHAFADGTSFNQASCYAHMGTNETLTFSVYVKAAERTQFFIQESNFETYGIGAQYDLLEGQVASVDADNPDYTQAKATITPVNNGWYRLSFTATKGTMNGQNFACIGFRNAPGGTADGAYFWGAQLESGSAVTSLIPTYGAAATRAADFISLNSSPWYASGGGTLKVDIITSKATQAAHIFELGNATDSLSLGTVNGSTGYVSAVPSNPAINGQTGTIGAVFRQVLSFTSGSYRYTSEGSAIQTPENSPNVPTPTYISIGGSPFGEGSHLNGHISHLTYFSQTNMTDSALRQMGTQSNRSCKTLKAAGFDVSGNYTIKPDGLTAMNVYCDMTTDGGGWTMLARSVNDGGPGTFGWTVSRGSVADDSHPYSFGTRAESLNFTDILYGNYTTGKTLSWMYKKSNLPTNYISTHRNHSDYYAPMCLNDGVTNFVMSNFNGFTDATDLYQMRDNGGPSFGLASWGWYTLYNDSNGGNINNQPGMLLVR